MRRLLWLAALLALPAGAAERAFAFTWDTASLPRGDGAIQLWVSPRLERTEAQYTRFDFRAGLASGLTDRLESLLTLDLDLQSFGVDSRSVDALVSWQLRYRLLPAQGPLGLGFFTRLALGPGAVGVEGRLLADKQLGAVLLAANASVTRTVTFSGDFAPDVSAEVSLAARYAVGNGVSVGLEGFSRSAFKGGAFEGTGYSVGPSFTWAGKRAWVALSWTAQVAADKASADVGNGEPLVLRDQERFAGRLVVGVATP